MRIYLFVKPYQLSSRNIYKKTNRTKHSREQTNRPLHLSPLTPHVSRKKAYSAQRGRCFICDRQGNQHTNYHHLSFETTQSSQHGGPTIQVNICPSRYQQPPSVSSLPRGHAGTPGGKDSLKSIQTFAIDKPISLTLPSDLWDYCSASDPHPDTARNR